MDKIFKYKAVAPDGQITHGSLQAADVLQVEQQLWRQQLVILQVSLNPVASLKLWWRDTSQKSISSRQIMEFTRQFSILLSSGIAVIAALEISISQNKNQAFGKVLCHVLQDVRSGHSLAAAFQHFPKCFDQQYCQLVATGERSGKLVEIFQQLSAFLRTSELSKSKVKQAMIYPAVILLTSVLLISVLVYKVIPNFQSMFVNLDQPLPYSTALVIEAAQWFRLNLLNLCLAVVALFMSCKWSLRYSVMQQLKDKRLLRLPVFGQLLQKSLHIQISQTAALLLSAGVPIHEVIERLTQALNNRYYTVALLAVKQQVMAGEPLSQAMKQHKVFPELMYRLVNVGEESGELDRCFKQLCDIYQHQLDTAVQTLISVIEPSIMVVLGVIIGALILVMYLPLFELSTLV